MNDDEAANYDEFGMLEQYARFEGIPWHGRPTVERRSVEVRPGQQLSGLVWGTGEPELVLLHGGGQNAHTWDSVAMALGRPLVAFDMPGHGHSDWREDRDYGPAANAQAVAAAMEQLAPRPEAVVGMSLGGLTNIHLAASRPELVPRVVIVDVTPGVGARSKTMTQAQRGATALIGGPPVYESFEAMLQATAAAVPGRPPESLRPGILHNARRLDDGRWAWRYDRLGRDGEAAPEFTSLWEDLEGISVPMMLVRGANSAHVHDDDQAELVRRQPGARVEIVEGAGHSVQSDRASRLAELISDFLGTT
jgi:pimeloyl-ACP methyl ester carboxylesterase